MLSLARASLIVHWSRLVPFNWSSLEGIDLIFIPVDSKRSSFWKGVFGEYQDSGLYAKYCLL